MILSGSAFAASPTKLPPFPRRRESFTEARGKARHAGNQRVTNLTNESGNLHHRPPGHAPFTYASNTVGSSANDTVRKCDASLSHFHSFASLPHSSRRNDIGQFTLSMPSSSTPRRMNGITVVFTSQPCARPTLAMVPPTFITRVSHESCSPPRLSTAPKAYVSGPNGFGHLEPLRTSVVLRANDFSRSASFSLPVTATTS